MSSVDRIFYIGATVSRGFGRSGNAGDVSCFQSALYHGWQRNSLESERSEAVEPEFAINTAVRGLRLPGCSAIVSPRTAEKLVSHVRGVLFDKPQVTLAFHRVVNPNDGIENKFAGIALSPEALLDEYLSRSEHRDRVPDLVRLEPTAAGNLASVYPETRERKLSIPEEGRDVYIEFARAMVRDFGLLWSFGLLCSHAVFDIFSPEVSGNPYFAIAEL